MTIERAIRWILGLVLLLLVIIEGVWFFNGRALREAEAAVQHTLDVQNDLERLLNAVQDTETAYRGFVITGLDSYLEPDAAGRRAAPALLDDLATKTGGSPAQQQRLADLRALIRDKFAFGARAVAARRSDGVGAASALVAGGTGKRQMDAIRNLVDALREDEQRVLASRRASVDARTRRATVVGATAAAILAFGVIIFLMFVRRDMAARARITEALRRSEETMRASTVLLGRSNRDLQDFAMIASHDLQEPLRKIQMFGDRLHDVSSATMSAEGLDYLRRMQSAAYRGQVLIEGLLTYSRVTTKAQPTAAVDLGVVARDVVDDLEARLAAVGGHVSIGALPTIEADAVQMRQLFQNLIGNALKFHRDGEPPRITIDARRLAAANHAADDDRERWVISFADNGVGFDEKYLDRIFKLFQRLHERQTYEGAGMGLAICRKIVERHGGSITARSAPGLGSTFLVTLPNRQRPMETNV